MVSCGALRRHAWNGALRNGHRLVGADGIHSEITSRRSWQYGARTIRSSCRAGAEAFKRDNPNAIVRFFDTGHFALETHATEIADAIRDFLS